MPRKGTPSYWCGPPSQHDQCLYKGMSDPASIGCSCSCHPENFVDEPEQGYDALHIGAFETCPACQPHSDPFSQRVKHGAALAMDKIKPQGGTHMATNKQKISTAASELTLLAKQRRGFTDADWQSAAERKAEEARKAAKEAEYQAELKTGFDAAQAARERFAAVPDAEFAFHLHHERFYEKLLGDGGATGIAAANERIDFVLTSKRLDELVPRLRVMRPIPNDRLPESIDLATARYAALKARDDAYAALTEATRKGSAARNVLSNAHDDFVDADSPAEKREQYIAAIDAYIEAEKKGGVAAARATHRMAESAYNTLLISRDDKVFAEDAMYVLHAELCEPDCPWTREHQSVLPEAK